MIWNVEFLNIIFKILVLIANCDLNQTQMDWYGMDNYQPQLSVTPNQQQQQPQQMDMTTNQWNAQQAPQAQPSQPTGRNDFVVQMCREREYRINWELILETCKNNLKFGPTIYSRTDRTNAKYSKIINERFKDSGEYSSFVIKTFDNNNQPKRIGGDTIRVLVNGTASLESFVYDMNNGEYETSFLLLEPGVHFVDVILEGSLCSSYVNPPSDWFNKGDRIGSVLFCVVKHLICV